MEAIDHPRGFFAAGTACGLKKKGTPDLGLLISRPPARAFAVFTRNQVKAAPVLYGRELLDSGSPISHVVVNSGNANACTGERGLGDVRATAATVREHSPGAAGIFVSSTGVIGEFLPMDRLKEGLARLLAEADRGETPVPFAEAILTTDTVSKESTRTLDLHGREVRLGGAAKGSGMIRPDMATMLAYITTDLDLDAPFQGRFSEMVDRSFNSITVDGDMSTNDTVLLLANGASGAAYSALSREEKSLFAEALEGLCRELAQKIVRDGEGATRFVTVEVRGAADDAGARAMARAICLSPLVKTAFFGGDPNWGRILAAAGSCGPGMDPARVDLDFCGERVMAGGLPVPCDIDALSRKMAQPEVCVALDLNLGSGAWTYWTCDLSYDYVKINAAYRT